MKKKHIGTGYTKAEIIAERLPNIFGENKFIGYIPMKDEFIVATKFQHNSYGWSKYFMNITDLVEYLRENNYDSLALEVYEYMDARIPDYMEGK